MTRKWGEHPNDGKGLERISARLKAEQLPSKDLASLEHRLLTDEQEAIAEQIEHKLRFGWARIKASRLIVDLRAQLARLQRENDSLARDCNDKDITIERLRTALATANANHERFEREWYLRGDEIERLHACLTGISTCSTCEACSGAALRALGHG